MKFLIVFLCVPLFYYDKLLAQPADTLANDSLKIYRDIERLAKKRPYTYLLYKAIFNLPRVEEKQEQQIKAPQYERYSGRVIRNILITTLDPLGYSIRDTSSRPRSWLEKSVNSLHKKSFNATIRNQLLFKRGDRYDPLKVKETERILRQAKHVNDVLISVVPVPNTKDSVDIIIREQDVWSLEGGAEWLPSSWSLSATQNNFFGTSHRVKESIRFDHGTGYNHYGSYTIPYIRNTFINFEAGYYYDAWHFRRSLSISRSFFSPLTRWMGGIALSRNADYDSIPFINQSYYPLRIRTAYYDYWAGYSIPIVRRGLSEEERGTSFILTGRNVSTRYMLRPAAFPDSLWSFENTQFHMLGVGLSSRTYYRDYFIYRFGVPEDVPAGRKLNVVIGQELKETSMRFYLGVDCGIGVFIPKTGYFGLHGHYGSFINQNKLEQSVLNLDLGYFTELLVINRWRVRQFVRVRSVNGFNRLGNEYIDINGDRGLRGFNSSQAIGKSKFVMNFQTQAYLPYRLLGFNFAPIVFFGLAWVGDNTAPVFSTQMFQNYGLGVLIKNEYLVWKTFQFTMGLYPYVPGKNGSVVKFNPIKTYDFRFKDFSIDRPEILPYE